MHLKTEPRKKVMLPPVPYGCLLPFLASYWFSWNLERLFWGHNDSFDHDIAFFGAATFGFMLILCLWAGLSRFLKLSGEADPVHTDTVKKIALRIAILFIAFSILGFALPFSIGAARQLRGMYWILPEILLGLPFYGYFLYAREIKRLNSALV